MNVCTVCTYVLYVFSISIDCSHSSSFIVCTLTTKYGHILLILSIDLSNNVHVFLETKWGKPCVECIRVQSVHLMEVRWYLAEHVHTTE